MEHVRGMGEMRNACKILLGKTEEEELLKKIRNFFTNCVTLSLSSRNDPSMELMV
jgi:hypothetical protein